MAVPALKSDAPVKPETPAAPPVAQRVGLPVHINGEVDIPPWVIDLASFRRWASSAEFPQRGRFAFLEDTLWVDLTMEQLFTHNQVKGEFAIVLGGLVKVLKTGRFFHDRTALTNPDVKLSTEPDGLFVSFQTLRDRRVRYVEGTEEDYVELEGTPDMVLEVVSPSTIQKDTVRLRDLYWRAGIPEYWLVDARPAIPRFDILRRGKRRYSSTPKEAGWLPSSVFGRSFRLTRGKDALGDPEYTLSIREP
jgi:Uma2 family endonuclease